MPASGGDLSSHQLITGAADGLQIVGRCGVIADFLPDAGHVDIDPAIVSVVVGAVELLVELIAGDNAAGLLGQVPEELELDGGEMGRPVCDIGVPPVGVDLQLTEG